MTTRLKLSEMEERKRKAELYDALIATPEPTGKESLQVAPVAESATTEPTWRTLNRERGELIHRKVAGTIMVEEAVRLAKLQALAEAYIDLVAPRDTAYLDEMEKRAGIPPTVSVAEPSAEECMVWMAQNCRGTVRGTDVPKWAIQGETEDANLLDTVRAAMKEEL